MRFTFRGERPFGVTAKDLALATCARDDRVHTVAEVERVARRAAVDARLAVAR